MGLEQRYNPNWQSQPRVPGGHPDGGRWTDSGAGTADAADRGSPIELAAGFSSDDRGMSVQDFIAGNCQAKIYRILPSQFLESTIAEVMELAKGGDAAARRCLKILS